MADGETVPEAILEAQAELERMRAERAAAEPSRLGAVLGESFVDRWRRVGETLPLLTDEQAEALAEERDFGMWPDRLHASGVVAELHDDDFGRLIRNECRDTRPMHVVRRWVHAHLKPGERRPPSWLFVCGGVGVGKTVAAAWALAQVGGAYTTMHALLAEYGGRARRNNRDGDDPFPRRLERASLVVLDELGTERSDQAELAREVVFRLVSRRQSQRRMTLVLTNDDTHSTRERFQRGVYDVRSFSRLQPMWWLASAGDESLRKPRDAGAM